MESSAKLFKSSLDKAYGGAGIKLNTVMCSILKIDNV